MRPVLLIPIILGAAAVISFAGLLATDNESTQQVQDSSITNDEKDKIVSNPPTSENDEATGTPQKRAFPVFSYYNEESVRSMLDSSGMTLSYPVLISDHTISQYCSYYDDEEDKFETTAYCTTSAITDEKGITLGVFNMGGNAEYPTVTLAVLDAVKPMGSSGREDAETVFSSVIGGLICPDCWARERPGGFESIPAWMDAAESMLAENPEQSSLKSTISGFAGVNITLEATTVTGGYEWTLVIRQR